MSTAGPNSPATMADDNSVGTVAWANVNNAKVSDNVYTSLTGIGFTHYLKATGFGFSIPAGATIDGVLVEIERKDALLKSLDIAVYLVVGDSPAGDNKSTGTALPASEAYKSYGGSSDVWGLSLTVSQINGSDFGVAYQIQNKKIGKGAGTPLVDHIRITVYYTAGGGNSASVSPSLSPSASVSPSASISPSLSPSASVSPSAGLTTEGSVCWGHITGVVEQNVRTFATNWAGTGTIENGGDAERVALDVGQSMISEVVFTDIRIVELLQNHYATGDTVSLLYRHGATEGDCLSASWTVYSVPFESLSYVQAKIAYPE